MTNHYESQPLIGSECRECNAQPIGEPHSRQTISLTVVLKRRQPISKDADGGRTQHLTHRMLEKKYGLSRDTMKSLRQFAQSNSLRVKNIDREQCTAKLIGTVKSVEKAFEVRLRTVLKDNRIFMVHDGPISVPKTLAAEILGVFGLNTLDTAIPHIGSGAGSKLPDPGLEPAQHYSALQGDAGGQVIGLIQTGGRLNLADIEEYFASLRMPAPIIRKVMIDGALEYSSATAEATTNVTLDIEVAGAVARGVTLVVYFAPNTDKGFLHALLRAVHDKVNKPAVILIGWSTLETGRSDQFIRSKDQILQAASGLGIAVVAAESTMDQTHNAGAPQFQILLNSEWVSVDQTICEAPICAGLLATINKRQGRSQEAFRIWKELQSQAIIPGTSVASGITASTNPRALLNLLQKVVDSSGAPQSPTASAPPATIDR
ncbi:MAG TPA: protease pro-enzyme activation domain-containing protein [Chroococcales cyanobacterium]